MSPQYQFVKKFLEMVRRQKNRHRLWTVLIWATMLWASLSIATGLFYVLRGYAVPGTWTIASAGTVLLIAVAVWILRRLNLEQTARFTDHFFHLQDTVTSYLHFSRQGQRHGYYALQAQQTANRVAELDADSIRYQPPKRLLYCTACLLFVAIPLSLLPDSDAVAQQRQAEELTKKETAAINAELEKEVEKLIEEVKDENEEKLLDPSKLRRWVKELKTMENQNEALRQYARLQRNLKKTQKALQNQKDEQLLKRAAKELDKKEETKELAKSLQQKKYDEAAKQLEKLKPEKAKTTDRKKRDLAKLRAIAQRMATAARMGTLPAKSAKPTKSKNAGQSKPTQKQGKGNGSCCNAALKKSGKASGATGSGELSETIGELAEAMENLEKMEKGEEQICELVDKLGKCMKKMGMCQRTNCRLARLCRSCSQCQNRMCRSCCICQSPKSGIKPGWGTNSDRRDTRDELIDNDQTTQLKGTKGRGPSLTAVEAAAEGSGISNRRSAQRERQFKNRVESFVQREDVPEAVKDGVKKYFQIIHEAEQKTSLQQ